MMISRPVVRIALVVLFILAVWVRLDHASDSDYPYYRGGSATSYRHASLVAELGKLPSLDDRTWWPEGYAPARVAPNGVEVVTGYAYRLASFVSESSLKEFAGRLSIVVFSFCVFTFYWITRQLWASPSAGLLAALLVAFSHPLIVAASGREFGHAPYAILLISFHLGTAAHFARRRRPWALVVMPLAVLALAAVWRTADLYVVLFGLLILFTGGPTRGDKGRVAAVHLAALITAGLLLPHLRAEKFLWQWPVGFLLASTMYFFAGRVLPRKVPGWVWVGAATVAVFAITRPLASGDVAALSDIDYWLYRVRFLFGKPLDPLALSDSARFMWTSAHAFSPLVTIFAFVLPCAFLIRPMITSLRDEGPRPLWAFTGFAVLGLGLFVIDRSAVYAAALFVFPLLAVAARGVARARRSDIVLVVTAALILVWQAVAPPGKASPAHMLASAVRVPVHPVNGFFSISIGNADLGLVRHAVSRTSVAQVMLTPPDVSTLLVGFAGRKTVLTPGVFIKEAMERQNGYMRQYFGPEDELFAVCDAYDIDYVLYSIDLLLDDTAYSQRYDAGLSNVDEESVAYKMHFEPQNLEHFNLVFQNDNYRLFRVTRETMPMFLTDHPPVFQKSILERNGGDLRLFYEKVVDAILAYQLAIDAQQQGDDSEAVNRFRYCLDIAPLFTDAWLGVGDSLFRMGDFEAARAAYGRALEASPDNPTALYNMALALVRTGEPRRARGLLDVLIASTRDMTMIARARELQAAIDRDYPDVRSRGE